MTKPKVFNLFSLTLIAICCFFAGIYAVLLHTTTTTTSVGFTATGISGTVTGTLGSADRDTFTGTAYEGENLVTSFSKKFDPKNGLTTENATWNVGELTFLTNDTGITGYITLTLTFTNTGSNDMYLTFSELAGIGESLGMQYVVDSATSSKQGSLVTQDSYQIKALPNDNNLTISFQLYVANEGLNMTNLDFGLNFNLSPSGTDQVTPVVTTDSNIDTGASIIPAVATPGQDYTAIINFKEGHILDKYTTTVTVGETPTDYTWNPTAKTLTIEGESITSTTAPTLNLTSIGFSGGDGSVENPFEIATAEEFKTMPEVINVSGSAYAGLNYKLTQDIDLNPNTTFNLNEDYGMVEITQNSETIYKGTGLTPNVSITIDSVANSTSTVSAYYILSATNTFTTITPTVNGNITTYNSISLEAWTPIGDYQASIPFAGVFDGSKKILNGIFLYAQNDYAGLYSYNSNASKILNININNSLFGSTKHYFGGVIGSNKGLVENCKICCDTLFLNNIDAITPFWSDVGGIVGENVGIINACQNEALIISSGYSAGGICGENNAIVANCKNSGSIQLILPNIYTTGGICGGSYYDSSIVVNCINVGTILSTKNVGGIIGYGAKNKSSTGEAAPSNIKNSINIGVINSNLSYCGAIMGYTARSDIAYISDSYYLKNSAYYLNTETNEKQYMLGIGGNEGSSSDTLTNAQTTGMEAEEMKSQLFINTLNQNIANMDDVIWSYGGLTAYKSDLKLWELGDDGWPTLSDKCYGE